MGVNLRTIRESMSVADIANDFDSLKTGISALSSPGIPLLDSRNLRALEVVFLKGPNDALGGVIRTLLKTAQKAGLVLRTPFDVCQPLQSRTQGRPIKGKYSVFTQYVFHCVNPGDVDLVPSGKTVPGITKFYSWRCCRDENRIMRRRLPCFCSKCVAEDWDACKKEQISGPWDSCKVREKPSNASQDSECASQASDLSDMSDDSCFA